jgi:hypothetical protein
VTTHLKSLRTNMGKVEEADGLVNAADLKKIQSTGLITVSFRFIKDIRPKSQAALRISETQSMTAVTDLDKLGAIPEKALKGDARSHQAGFVVRIVSFEYQLNVSSLGKPYASPRRDMVHTYSYVDDGAFAVFKFKYRSLGEYMLELSECHISDLCINQLP